MTRVTVLVLLLSLSVLAQRRPGSGSIPGIPSTPQQASSLQVRIVTENDRPVEEMARVQLLRADGTTEVAEAFARDGMAQFAGVRPGSYVLRVTGVNLQDTTTPSFTLPAMGGTIVEFVHVKMKPPVGAAAGGSDRLAVSAQDLNVPRKAKEEFHKAGEAMQHSDWKKATEHFDKAISIYPQYAAAYNNLGFLAMKQKDLPRAKAMFEKATDLNDSTGYANLNLGRLYLMERNFEEAGKLMNRSLALDPNNPEALTLLADCELATGHYAEAVSHARRVHGLPHERFAVAHLIAGAALEKQNDPKDATAEYEQFLKEDPQSPRAAGARKALERLSAQAQPGLAAPKP